MKVCSSMNLFVLLEKSPVNITYSRYDEPICMDSSYHVIFFMFSEPLLGHLLLCVLHQTLTVV